MTEFKPGDHVIACLSVFCGHCDYCLTGQDPPLPVAARARAERAAAAHLEGRAGEPVREPLARTPRRCWFTRTRWSRSATTCRSTARALIGCGVTTGVGAVLNTARVEAGSTVAVFGAGGVGLAAIQGARIAGARMIIAVDVLESKLAKAKELGATHTVDASSKVDPVKAIRELTNGGVDYAFEAIGLKKAAEQAFECIRPGGTATVIGMIPVGQKLELEGSVFLREKRIQGCSMGSNRFKVDMPQLRRLLPAGPAALDEMITRRGRLEDVNEAFRAMKAGEVARTVLMFE